MVETAFIESHLKQLIFPFMTADLGSINAVKAVSQAANGITVQLQLGFPVNSVQAIIADFMQQALQQIGVTQPLKITYETTIRPHAKQVGLSAIAGVKNVIAVVSGKGGVGKSATAVNLAIACQRAGARVGLLDADIYGPSVPMMMGLQGKRPHSVDGKHFEPLQNHGIQTMSIGYLVDQDTAMIWRGPMATGALAQLAFDTAWQDVDYLLVDMPPGTGDIQLSLAQKIPVAGAVVVTTPQDIALLDVRKAITMFTKVNVPILGIVENMSYYECPCCHHRAAIFGEGGADSLVQSYGVACLGKIPLNSQIRSDADSGCPTVVADPDGPIARQYQEMALRLTVNLSCQAKDFARRFPKIVIESN